MMLRDLEWLVTVSELEHVTDAAALLGTNQPTLSRALARVEDELGVRVFERSYDGVHPTPTGQIVVAAARDLTERYAQLLADLETALDPDAGVVRLAFLDSIATSLVPKVLHEVHGQAPKVRVLLRQEPGHEIAADLASGAVDLAITSPRPDGPFGWLPLQEERLVLTVPAQHRLRDRKRLTLAAIADDELVTTPVGFGYRDLVDSLLREAGVAPVVSFESQDLATIEGLVAAGLGVAILPAQFAGLSGTVGIPITANGARRTIGLTWRSDREPSPPAARFRELVSRLG